MGRLALRHGLADEQKQPSRNTIQAHSFGVLNHGVVPYHSLHHGREMYEHNGIRVDYTNFMPSELSDVGTNIRDFAVVPCHHPKLEQAGTNLSFVARHLPKRKALIPAAIRQMREYIQFAVDTRGEGRMIFLVSAADFPERLHHRMQTRRLAP